MAYRPKKLLDAHRNPMTLRIQPIGFSGRRKAMIVPTVDEVSDHATNGSKMIMSPCWVSMSSETTENTTVNVHTAQASLAMRRDLNGPFPYLAAATRAR